MFYFCLCVFLLSFNLHLVKNEKQRLCMTNICLEIEYDLPQRKQYDLQKKKKTILHICNVLHRKETAHTYGKPTALCGRIVEVYPPYPINQTKSKFQERNTVRKAIKHILSVTQTTAIVLDYYNTYSVCSCKSKKTKVMVAKLRKKTSVVIMAFQKWRPHVVSRRRHEQPLT